MGAVAQAVLQGVEDQVLLDIRHGAADQLLGLARLALGSSSFPGRLGGGLLVVQRGRRARAAAARSGPGFALKPEGLQALSPGRRPRYG